MKHVKTHLQRAAAANARHHVSLLAKHHVQLLTSLAKTDNFRIGHLCA